VRRILNHFPSVTLGVDVQTTAHRDRDTAYTLICTGRTENPPAGSLVEAEPARGEFHFGGARLKAPHHPGSFVLYYASAVEVRPARWSPRPALQYAVKR
jgi:hypothetical protein